MKYYFRKYIKTLKTCLDKWHVSKWKYIHHRNNTFTYSRIILVYDRKTISEYLVLYSKRVVKLCQYLKYKCISLDCVSRVTKISLECSILYTHVSHEFIVSRSHIIHLYTEKPVFLLQLIDFDVTLATKSSADVVHCGSGLLSSDVDGL